MISNGFDVALVEAESGVFALAELADEPPAAAEAEALSITSNADWGLELGFDVTFEEVERTDDDEAEEDADRLGSGRSDSITMTFGASWGAMEDEGLATVDAVGGAGGGGSTKLRSLKSPLKTAQSNIRHSSES